MNSATKVYLVGATGFGVYKWMKELPKKATRLSAVLKKSHQYLDARVEAMKIFAWVVEEDTQRLSDYDFRQQLVEKVIFLDIMLKPTKEKPQLEE